MEYSSVLSVFLSWSQRRLIWRYGLEVYVVVLMGLREFRKIILSIVPDVLLNASNCKALQINRSYIETIIVMIDRQTDGHTQTHTYTHKHTQTHTNTHTHRRRHRERDTHTHTHTHTHTQTHTHKNTCTQTHTQTHTHT